MSAEFNTSMKISATREELKKVFLFLKEYEDGEDLSFESMDISSSDENGQNLFDMDEDEIDDFLKTISREVCVEAMGPYGYFDIEDLPLFLDIAHTIPYATITMMVQGFDDGGDHRTWCEAENGRLSVYYKYTDYDADDEEYENLEEYDTKKIYDTTTKKRLRK